MGLGDSIHFARYIPLLAGRGARVVARVQAPLRQAPLRTLIATVDGVLALYGKDDPLPEFDLALSAVEPAARLRHGAGQHPGAHALPAAARKCPGVARPPWRERQADIGVVWSGNARHANDRNRSIRLETLRLLFDSDATFVSLSRPNCGRAMRQYCARRTIS